MIPIDDGRHRAVLASTCKMWGCSCYVVLLQIRLFNHVLDVLAGCRLFHKMTLGNSCAGQSIFMLTLTIHKLLMESVTSCRDMSFQSE